MRCSGGGELFVAALFSSSLRPETVAIVDREEVLVVFAQVVALFECLKLYGGGG